MTTVLGIDPGLSGTGWALFRVRRSELQAIGIVRGSLSTDQPLADRCGEIADKLLHQTWQNGMHVVLEMPQMMTNIRGIAAQAGSVYKLAFLVGCLARAFEPSRITVVTPMEWKGQLPKDVVQRRIERQLGPRLCKQLNIRSHAWDAVGLGLWLLEQKKKPHHGGMW